MEKGRRIELHQSRLHPFVFLVNDEERIRERVLTCKIGSARNPFRNVMNGVPTVTCPKLLHDERTIRKLERSGPGGPEVSLLANWTDQER